MQASNLEICFFVNVIVNVNDVTSVLIFYWGIIPTVRSVQYFDENCIIYKAITSNLSQTGPPIISGIFWSATCENFWIIDAFCSNQSLSKNFALSLALERGDICIIFG